MDSIIQEKMLINSSQNFLISWIKPLTKQGMLHGGKWEWWFWRIWRIWKNFLYSFIIYCVTFVTWGQIFLCHKIISCLPYQSLVCFFLIHNSNMPVAHFRVVAVYPGLVHTKEFPSKTKLFPHLHWEGWPGSIQNFLHFIINPFLSH